MKKTTLFEHEGDTSIHISAEIKENGDLELSGQDIGEAPHMIHAGSDYEYWLTIPADQKDELLLSLLHALYEHDSRVISRLRELMTAHGIKHRFFCY